MKRETKIFQCIPGSGKTHLANVNNKFTDSDDLLASMGLKGKSGYDRLLSNPKLKAELVKKIDSALLTTNVLCNFDPEDLGLRCDNRFSYRWKEYVNHLKLIGRKDLLSNFTTSQLEGWALDYYDKKGVVFLEVGQFISEIFKENENVG